MGEGFQPIPQRARRQSNKWPRRSADICQIWQKVAPEQCHFGPLPDPTITGPRRLADACLPNMPGACNTQISGPRGRIMSLIWAGFSYPKALRNFSGGPAITSTALSHITQPIVLHPPRPQSPGRGHEQSGRGGVAMAVSDSVLSYRPSDMHDLPLTQTNKGPHPTPRQVAHTAADHHALPVFAGMCATYY